MTLRFDRIVTDSSGVIPQDEVDVNVRASQSDALNDFAAGLKDMTIPPDKEPEEVAHRLSNVERLLIKKS